MKLLDTFYYYYFGVYKRILKDPEPHFSTVLGLAFSCALLVNGVIDLVALKYYCYQVEVWVQFSIVLLIIGILYLIYHKTGKAKKVVANRQFIFNSSVVSAIATLLFFLLTLSWLFWGPIYGRSILESCK